MKRLLVSGLVLLSFSVAAKSNYLKDEDQKYYRNDSMDGNNKLERIDSLVKEVNKMYGDLASMKAEIKQLREEVEELKKKK